MDTAAEAAETYINGNRMDALIWCLDGPTDGPWSYRSYTDAAEGTLARTAGIVTILACDYGADEALAFADWAVSVTGSPRA